MNQMTHEMCIVRGRYLVSFLKNLEAFFDVLKPRKPNTIQELLEYDDLQKAKYNLSTRLTELLRLTEGFLTEYDYCFNMDTIRGLHMLNVLVEDFAYKYVDTFLKHGIGISIRWVDEMGINVHTIGPFMGI